MSASLTTHKMGQRHEEDLAEVLGGRMTRGSGNQWRDATDGKHDGSQMYSLAWDGKSTLGKSISITREMWAKLVEQAEAFIPALPLRFYADQRLTKVAIDLIALPLESFAEILADANTLAKIREHGCLTGSHITHASSTCEVCGVDMYDVGAGES